MGKPWRADEEIRLELLVKEKGLSLGEIYRSKRFKGRSYTALSMKLHKMKSKSCRKGVKYYSDEEVWKIWIYYKQGLTAPEIGYKLNRHKKSISNQITRFGMVYSTPYLPCPEYLKPEVNAILKKMNSK
jgi:hypothetical protein